jgi:hypothetical protein
MNRSPASKTKVVSKAVRVASKAAADSRSQASRASSPDRAVSKSLGKAAKAVSRASAKVTASPTRSSFPPALSGDFFARQRQSFLWIVLDEAHLSAPGRGGASSSLLQNLIFGADRWNTIQEARSLFALMHNQ